MHSKTLLIGRADGWLNLRLASRVLWANLTLIVLAALLALFALCYGTLSISPGQVWQALQGEGPRGFITVIAQWRAPRAVMALVLGAGLGVSGAIFQSAIRNPLGSPDVVGFNTGAFTGALVMIIGFGGTYYQIAAGALVGGIGSAALVYLLAWRQGIVGFRLIIVGIGVGAVLSALNTWLIVSASLESAMSAALWGAGSLNGITWAKGQPALLLVPLTIAVSLLLSRRLQLMEMGDDSARALGVNAESSRLWLMLCGIILTAIATASAGPIAFIALAAPQIARRLTGASAMPLFSATTTGALLLLTADVIAQHAFNGIQLPVGAVTVSIGGVYLIWLLIRESRR
ncbi:iron-enterobactin ABC transporter permease [Pantoea agglomerans]|uniref:Iron-enterobactin ABC transporter permease n=1 Tax=Enterobacter agglomerans TaxID=549 RepID=A0ACC5RGB6_ENTAG|nr:iron-enterobactin ABC transporter permease [Pantoea agglomerans]MBK4723665.1 iron-enterobactin ABC transporter permease [Pantoea agglomerans]